MKKYKKHYLSLPFRYIVTYKAEDPTKKIPKLVVFWCGVHGCSRITPLKYRGSRYNHERTKHNYINDSKIETTSTNDDGETEDSILNYQMASLF